MGEKINASLPFAQFDQNLWRLCGCKHHKFIYISSDFLYFSTTINIFYMFITNVLLSSDKRIHIEFFHLQMSSF